MKMLALVEKAKELMGKEKEETATALYMQYAEEADRAQRVADEAAEKLAKFEGMTVDQFLDYHGM